LKKKGKEEFEKKVRKKKGILMMEKKLSDEKK
jgi:hypothetical protein